MKAKSNKSEVVIVIPAYNSERTLKRIYEKIPKEYKNKVIIVDDGSKDKTVKVIKSLGVKPIVHKKNLGYGANQKTLYTHALKSGAKYIIMLHPDGQYNPKDLPKFINALKSQKGDLILGSRFLNKGDKGTPKYKALSIRMITLLFNLILGTKLTEANTGYRGFTKELLSSVPFLKNGNGYIFDPQIIIQAVYFGFNISDVPVTKEYNAEAISPNFKKSFEHGIENIRLLLEYTLHKWNIQKTDFLTSERRIDL